MYLAGDPAQSCPVGTRLPGVTSAPAAHHRAGFDMSPVHDTGLHAYKGRILDGAGM